MLEVFDLVVMALQLWLFGSFVFLFFAVSDLMFSRKHKPRPFLVRLFFVITWPLALFSANGRAALFGKLKGI